MFVPASQGWWNDQTKSQRKTAVPTSDDKNAVALVKIVPQLGCVARLGSTNFSKKTVQGNPMQKVLGPIRRIRFTQSPLDQASIRENKGPSFGNIQVKIPHQRSPHAMKFEDQSHEETERQQRCGRSKAWILAKNIYTKKKTKLHSTHPRKNGYCRLSAKEPEEREFVVDSGASMQLVSKRDLDSAELETMRTSRSPRTVMTANGEVQTREEATVHVKELDLFVTVILLETPAVLSLGKLCDDHGKTDHWTTGQKPSHQKWHYVPFINEFLYNTHTYFFIIFITRFCIWRQQIHRKSRTRKKEVRVRSCGETRCINQQKPKLKKRTRRSQSDLSDELPDWLQEFTGNLVDERSPSEPRRKPWPGYRDTSNSSHELPMESRAQVQRVRLSIVSTRTFRRTQTAMKTKITRASCRRRAGTVVPRAEDVGDLITADHKVLNEEGESRNSHRCAVVAQDLATQWIQSHPCKTKTSQETQKNLMKFLKLTKKPKVIYTDKEFGKSCEELSWNHCTSTPHRSETNGIAERAVRRVKEGTSAVLLQSGLGSAWWADSIGVLLLSAKYSGSFYLMGNHHVKGSSDCPSTGQ